MKIKKDKKNEYFIAICKDQKKKWKVYDRNNVMDIDNPSLHEKGMILVLFYSAKNLIGE